ncbi:ATP12 family chaperone protein [Methylocella sp.]|uniref:ATP12 family chaperone protein n=1 Tax=Methylocella sp. TaxID=1978226 RepID=UPI003784FA4A
MSPKDPPEKATPDHRADFAAPPAEIDPVALARRDLAKSLPKRFYQAATAAPVEDGFALLLDGRPARTPARNKLVLPTRAAAEAVAREWDAQRDLIDPAAMPLTRIVNSAIDGVAREMEATAAEVARYGASDLVCYRAPGPDALVRAESALWDPVLVFAREQLGARLLCAEGVTFVEQPEPARRALLEAARAAGRAQAGGAFALAALHVMTSLTGSALLAFAVARGALSPQEAWAAAHVDEDYEMRLWGEDDEALAARARRWREMEAAALLTTALAPDPADPA